MEQGQVEEKLKIEGEILSLKKEHKHMLSVVDNLKKEVTVLLQAKERSEKAISDNKAYLTEVLNDISDAKLKWVTQKDKEMEEIALMKKEAQKVLDRITEVDTKLSEDKVILQKNTDILNEKRRLELKMKQDKTIFETEKRALEKEKEDFSNDKATFETTKVEFKEKLKSLVQNYG